MAARRIRYGTPSQFQTVTHAQLEHFDNKPPPQPLEESESVAKATETTQSKAKTGKVTDAKTKSKDETMHQSEGNTSTITGGTTATQTAVRDDDWIPDRGGGWDGKVTKYDASTMYLG